MLRLKNLDTYACPLGITSGVTLLWVLLLLLVPQHSTAQPTSGLVAYWAFTNNTNDGSGNGHTATPSGGAGYTQDRFGNQNRAITLDGTDDYLTVSSHADLNFGPSFTISLWYRTCTDYVLLRPKSLILKRSGGTETSYGYNIGFGNSMFGASSNDDGRSTSGPAGTSKASGEFFDCGGQTPYSYTDGRWHHVVYVLDADNGVAKFIIDDDVTCTNTYNTTYSHADNTYDLLIGRNDGSGRSGTRGYFPGDLDDIRFYNRALSATEITSLYTEGGWPGNAHDSSISFTFEAVDEIHICEGDSVRLHIGGNADYYLWNTTEEIERPYEVNPVAKPTETRTYRVTGYRQVLPEPCADTVSQTREVTIIVDQAPDARYTPSYYKCTSDTFDLEGLTTGGLPPYRWQWSPATGLSDATAANPRVVANGPASYRLEVTDAKGCRDTATVTITVVDPPEVEIVGVGDTAYLCVRPGQGSRLELEAVGSSGNPPYRYAWRGVNLDRTDTSHVIAQPTTPTTYVVEVWDAAGICPDIDSVLVIPVSAPTVAAGTAQRLCPGESYQLGSGSNPSGLEYVWSPSATLDDPSLSQPTATPTATTTYHVTATDPLTGCVAVDSVRVTIEDIRLSIAESSLEFKALDGCESTVTGSITVRNEGGDAARLRTGGSRDGFVVLVGGERNIPGGTEITVEFRFTPPTAGTYSGEIVLHVDPCGDSLVLLYTGERATSNVSATPTTIDFGRAADCGVAPQQREIVVTNNGTDAAVIAAPTPAAPYSVISPVLPATLAPGESLRITIEYAPTGVGSFAGTLHVPYRNGLCIDSIPVELDGEVWEPLLTTEDTPLDFGLLDGCTTEADGVVEVVNPGKEPLSLEVILPIGVSIAGGPAQVSAGGSATLQLRYAPAGTGTLNDEALVIYGPCSDTLRVALVGEKRGVSFAIVDTLDFGELCLGEAAALPLAVLLDSEGTGDGTVVEAVFTGAGFAMDAMDRMDIMDADGAALVDGVKREFGLEFEPTAEGPITGTLRLRLEPCSVERTVVLRGSATNVQLTSPGLDFGTQPSGTTTAGTLSYTNTGTSRLHIDRLDESALGGTPFTVVSTTPPLPVDLAPGASVDIEVEYVVAAGPSNATLGAVIAEACDTTVVATIRGTGESNGFVRMKLPQLTGEPGEALQLTIEVEQAAGLPAEGVGFRAEVSVEPSILSVADATPWRIANGGQRVIEIEGVVRPNESVAASVPVIALLGRVESSPLELISIELSDPAQQVAMEVEDGSLEIFGLCREGGVRLFDPSGEIAIKSIAPSPTQNQMTITYSLSETGEHRMVLVDVGGREVLEIFSGMMLPGTFELVRDVAALPSGAYRLVLQTPTLRVSEGVVIGR